MKSNRHRLLDDVFEATAPSDFRADVLSQTIVCARRRKRARTIQRGIAVSSLALLIIFAVGRELLRKDELTLKPLPRAHIQASQTSGMIPTSTKSIEIVRTDPLTIQIVESRSVRNEIKFLSDEELLALFPNRPTALVATAPSEKQLIFLDAQDENRAPFH